MLSKLFVEKLSCLVDFFEEHYVVDNCIDVALKCVVFFMFNKLLSVKIATCGWLMEIYAD